MLHLLCARLCTKYFTNINSLNLGNNPILIIILILQVRKWGTDWLSNLPKVNSQAARWTAWFKPRQFGSRVWTHTAVLCCSYPLFAV